MTMKKITLFYYQEDMVKRVQEAFRHHDSVMVQMGILRILRIKEILGIDD